MRSSLPLALLVALPATAQVTHFRYVDPSVPGVGWSVRALGDLDGDGTPDVAVGSYRQDCGFAGCGAAQSKLAFLSGVDGSVLFTVAPAGANDGTGYSIDVLGDVNGDGFTDFVIGEPNFGGPTQNDGQVEVLSGAAGAVLLTIASPQTFGNFGTSVAGLGDVDGDTVPDFAAVTWSGAWVYSGANGQLLRAFPSTSTVPYSSSVSRYGDYDGDGRADVLIGFTEGAFGSPGSAQIYSVGSGAVLKSFAAPTPEWTFGWSLDTVGDVDGDGKTDVIVGAPQIDFNTSPSGPGFAVLYSSTGAVIRQHVGPQLGGHFGITVAGGLDATGDGVPDYAVAKTCELNAGPCTREATLYSGFNGAERFTLTSPFTGDSGVSLDFVGDMNGDGRSELAFGTPCSEAWSDCGEARIVSDLAGGPTAYCTSGTSSHGCVPSIASSGVPSASASSGFTITASNIEGLKQGILFYGVSGRIALPWGTGTSFLCVKQPTQRMGAQSSGGTLNQCDGALGLDWLAFVAAHPGALGTPFQAGDVVDAQAWYRDPASPKTTNLSNALEFTLQP